MTRILRLLLIAAVAWPLCHPAAAQEVKPEQSRSPQEMKIQEMKDAAGLKNNVVVPKGQRKADAKSAGNVDVQIKAMPTESITLYPNATGTNKYVPVFGWYHDYSSNKSQIIYTSSNLEGLSSGVKITKLTFYTDDNGIKFKGGQLTFTIGETSNTRFTEDGLLTFSGTTVTGTVVPTQGSTTLSVTFDTPLEYTGSNLLVQVVNTQTGTCDPSSTDNTLWIGQSDLSSTSGDPWYASYCDKGNAGRQAFRPKMTIYYQQPEPVVANGTTSNQYLPVYGYWFDAQSQHNQMIYPASMFGSLVGKKTRITSMTFYSESATFFSGGNVTISLGNTTQTTFSSATDATCSDLKQVYSAAAPGGTLTEWTIDFDQDFVYTGGNLLIDVKTTKGTYKSVKFLGVEQANASWYSYITTSGGGSSGVQNFLPKVSFSYEPAIDPRDITIKDEAFFSGKDYTWTDSEGTHTSYLNEPATTPEQMIAMLRKVYTDPEIPGNLKRGFAADGSDTDETNQAVYYSGVGGVKMTGSYIANADSYEYEDIYGWGITGNVNEVLESSYLASDNTNYIDYIATYAALDQEQYKPDNEGLTLLLVEMKDTYVDGSNNAIRKATTYATEYDRLKAYFANTVKSIRVITQAKRTGEGAGTGTLFKIDCDKMNKFFLLAKGQLHLDHNSYYGAEENASDLFTGDLNDSNWDFGVPPGYMNFLSVSYSNHDDWYNEENYTIGYQDGMFLDVRTGELFYHMFEQFSPSMPQDSVGALDLYQNMTTNMESFPVIHDCLGITRMNHQFMLYGADSKDDDCQDIRDLMFFIPDYRMLKHNNRDAGATVQQYLNYHTKHQPSMGMFIIKQYPITGEQIENQETYRLHLTWTSNLLKYLPSEQGQYTLYRVITNPDGTKTYQAVGEFNPNTFEYYDDVPMQKNGQQVTYVVQGQDVGKFLSLQMSNEESFIIPGLDRAEQIRIELNSDYYFSRYDAADQTNNYSNSLIANNTVGTNVKPQYIENGSQFKFWRATIDEQTGDVITPAEPFVVAEVSNWNASAGGTLTYKDWKNQTDFSSKPYGHGYHENVVTSTISVVNGEVKFDGLKLYDNFSVDVSENAHPGQYVYFVTLHTAVPFDLGDNSSSSVPAIATVQEGTYAYFEVPNNWSYNTIRAWAWKRVDNGDGTQTDINLTGNSWPGSGVMEYVGTLNNNNNVYRWIADETVTEQPTHIIFNGGWYDQSSNQTGTFEFTNGSYYTISGSLGTTNTSQEARSNTVSVPVYKTGMTMNPIDATAVENDVTHATPAATKFDLNARYSSKSEILGYYIYRWADGKTAANARSIYESNGDDASPQGQAGNQGEYYTVAMNTDFTGRTDNFASNHADVTASFEDNYMVNDAENGDTYTYAPVVELFAPVQAVELPSGADREDYNTYGGPQQMTAGGVVDVDVVKYAPSSYSWNAGGKEYRYYNVNLKVNPNKEIVPEGYEIAKVRAWRKIASKYLGEQAATQNTPDYTGRLNLDVNGEYMFVNKTDCQKGEELGDELLGTSGNNGPVYRGTFGAVALEQGDEIPMSFVVRVYFTKSQPAGAPMLKAEGDQRYYIAETVVEDKLTYQIPTGIDGVGVMNNVASVKYYNAAGIESDKPFQGVNIVVTRYNDGSTTTTKILK